MRQTKIGQLDVTAAVNQQILGLDVPAIAPRTS
jgi:hypothetical protein